MLPDGLFLRFFWLGMRLMVSNPYVWRKCLVSPPVRWTVFQANLGHDQVWIQPCHGEVPDFVVPDYNKCLMIKPAIDHYAFDFMIVDCTGLGTTSRLIYFVQVSVQAYQNRKSNRKYSAIERASIHTSGCPPLNYYSSKFNVQLSNCFYVYASSAESSFGRDAENVYTVDL